MTILQYYAVFFDCTKSNIDSQEFFFVDSCKTINIYITQTWVYHAQGHKATYTTGITLSFSQPKYK